MAYGDPSTDVGRFLASLRIPSLKAFGNISRGSNAGECFLEQYLRIVPGDPANIRLFEASSLVKTAASVFRIQRPGWQEEVNLLFDEAERVFQTAKKTKRISLFKAKEGVLKMTVDERREYALDAVYMRAALGASLSETYHAEIYSCTILETNNTKSGCLVLYKVEGIRNNKDWNLEVHALLPKKNKRAAFNRLKLLQKVSETVKEAFVIPSPLAFFSPIAAIVMKPLNGIPFSQLLEHSEPEALTSSLAGSFAVLHKTNIPCDKADSLLQLFHQLDDKSAKLKKHSDVYSLACKLIVKIRDCIPESMELTSCSIRGLGPGNVLWMGDRFGAAVIEKVVAAHPYLDVADFSARIRMLGIMQKKKEQAQRIANQFIFDCQTVTGNSNNLLPAFEALALVKLAYSQFARESGHSVCMQLLTYGEERLNR